MFEYYFSVFYAFVTIVRTSWNISPPLTYFVTCYKTWFYCSATRSSNCAWLQDCRGYLLLFCKTIFYACALLGLSWGEGPLPAAIATRPVICGCALLCDSARGPTESPLQRRPARWGLRLWDEWGRRETEGQGGASVLYEHKPLHSLAYLRSACLADK